MRSISSFDILWRKARSWVGFGRRSKFIAEPEFEGRVHAAVEFGEALLSILQS